MMRFGIAVALMGLILLVGGCGNSGGEKKMEPMGDAAPAFGSAGKTDLQSFIVGSWCFVNKTGEVQPGRYYNFTADGKFTCGGAKGEWDGGGSWTVNGETAYLKYETMKGKSFEDYRAEYKKDEEGGGTIAIQRALFYDGLYSELGNLGTLWVAEDQKHLAFSDPKAKPAAGGELGGLEELLKDSTALERTQEVKE